ncbi:MAG: PilZ domain-containing protein [Candidatus Omnitrophica bacterium]|nr:PilZ domain-containing protein [Candidatus Omnitrophota bacterium]MDD4940523.1 PilZ domain-containing protein [Candidatus Omnitrophota bacterium]MDD5774877.1 PilZ domain-containing protein [Candidatus Omnitrophota bacterium]HQQ06513.1 PilZ domain-containing protein [Candidatus Omnitrophota bacterium]
MITRTLRRKIGELLIERKVITHEELDQALEEQRQKGGYISQHLIALGFATEQDVAVALSNQYDFAYLPLKLYTIPRDVLSLVPLKWARLYSLIPIDKIGNTISVAMADPLNEGVIQMIHQMTNYDVKVFISTFSEIKEAIEHYYADDIRKMRDSSAEDLKKHALMREFIQTKAYRGAERRRYARINKKISMDYMFHGRAFQAQTVNISVAGICFVSAVALPVDVDLICELDFKEGKGVDFMVKILRVQRKESMDQAHPGFDIAGVFEFIGDDDRAILAEYLGGEDG